MKQFIFSGVVLALLGGAGLSGCATISEDKCLAGNWQELGYRDGSNGVKREKASKIADTCAKYGVDMNFDAYLTGFTQGLPTYCTYERGFALGENGASYNQVCSGNLAVDFAPGYDDGRAVYAIYQEHKSLISAYENTLGDIVEIKNDLDSGELPPKEMRRLSKQLRKFQIKAEDIKTDIRAWEYLHNLPRYQLG